jgi:hypothetical protein
VAPDRSRYGLLIAAIGAAVLAVSVFLPWYDVAFTRSGADAAAHAGQEAIERFGNASLAGYAAQLPAEAATLAGKHLASLTAHDVLANISVGLLIIAGLALLDAMFPLARGGRVPDGAGGALVLAGLLAGLLVVYRMVAPPEPGGAYLSLSLREGAWLSLLGAGAILAGGLLPRSVRRAADPPAPSDGVWDTLSGWSPQA